MIFSVLLMGSLAKGTVQISLVDGHKKPIANRQIWLYPTNSTKGVRSFGDIWWIPDEADVLQGTSDSKGVVKISGVPKGEPMMVITRFGNRFEEYLRKFNPNASAVDSMKFDGAVYAGKLAKITLSKENKIVGRVTNAETGAGVEGVSLGLNDTGFGHMGGYPLTELDETKSDAQGYYEFDRLPNCSFTVLMKDVGDSTGVESSGGNGVWVFSILRGEAGRFGGSWERSVQLIKPITQFDFRTFRAAFLKIIVRQGTLETMKGWSFMIQRQVELPSEGMSGHILGYVDLNKPAAPPKDIEIFKDPLIPGTHKVFFKRESDGAWFESKLIVLGYGESRTLDVSLSDVVKWKRVGYPG